MTKVKVAMDWLAACAGCEMSVLDMDERLIPLLDKIELTSTPITDLKHPPKDGVTVGILSGAVNNTTNLEVVKEMRERCKILIALGDCAVFGGIMTMRNFFSTEEVLRTGYVETASTEGGAVPRSEELTTLLDQVVAPNQIVKVDCYVPGCPPSAEAIGWALKELLAGRIPAPVGQNLRYD
jgi:NAD-reducing hydrogenase small subunit